MTRPTPFSYLIGNPLGCVTTLCFAGYTIVSWGTDQSGGNLLLAFVAVLACAASFKARKQIVSYDAWKREWDQMSGDEAQRDERRRKAKKFWRVLTGISIWCTALAVIVEYPDARGTPLYVGFELVFLGLTVLPLGWLLLRLYRLGRGIARHSKAARTHEHVVSVCLPVPRAPRRPESITAALPAYCQSLLGKPKE